jgi:spore coat protein A
VAFLKTQIIMEHAMPNLIPFLDDLPIPPVAKPFGGLVAEKHLAIKAKVKTVQLHQDLPATQVWSYRLSEGTVVRFGSGVSYLGPTVVVNKDDVVRVRWENKIQTADGLARKLPFNVVKIDPDRVSPDIPQNLPGQNGALTELEDHKRVVLRGLKAALVTHLHGGRTQADSDGWPDNTAIAGQSAHYAYSNSQPATLLWYHDHANHVTRLNVYAGLAGAWIIRDEHERSLKLPDGDFELPIVIQDRNLDVGADGQFTGALLHKTEIKDGPAEFFGPYTLVNGKIWPKAKVEPRLYRLRVLNGSNARTYRLVLLNEKGISQHANMWVIGADQGLAEHKMAFPEQGLLLSPGERADLLVNFAGTPNQRLYLWNTAEAPFGNNPDYLPDAASELAQLLAINDYGNLSDDSRRPYPQIMRFDVGASASSKSHLLPPDVLFNPKLTLATVDMPIRLMALIEKPPTEPTATAMLVFWEYVRSSDVKPPKGAMVTEFSYIHPKTNLRVTEQFWKAAEEFYDKVNWFVHQDSIEQWYIVNLSPDTHPIHIHLVDLQVNQQSNYEVYVNGDANPLVPTLPDTTPVIDGNVDSDGELVQKVDKIVATRAIVVPEDQAMPKDTIRVHPGEMIGVAIKFSPYAGKYMYHCHILEHEDDDMMRPFVIVPKWVPHHDH